MLFLDNNGVKLSYRIDGQGPPIVLIHGGFGYKEMWSEMGVVNSLKNDFKLISVDLRGHGESDKPHHPSDYRMTSFVSDILTVLDKLDISKVNYWGDSMGGWIGFGMVRYASERINTLICGGAQAHDEWTESWKSGWLTLFARGEKAVLKSIEEAISRSKNPEIEKILNHWLIQLKSADLKAIHALMSCNEQLQLDKFLDNLNIPCLFYGGETDTGSWIGFEDRFATCKNSNLLTIPGGHISAALSWSPLQQQVRNTLGEVID